MEKTSKIYVAGHGGLVGGAVLRGLRERGYTNIVVRTHAELDLLNQKDAEDFFAAEKPEYVFLAAARVGGIGANSSCPADFMYENSMIGLNVIQAAYKNKVKKIMNLGSSCIYPRLAPQPMKEEALLTGPLEPTNDAYALAKIGMIKLCSAFNQQYGTNYLSAMPCNLFGPGDNYDLAGSHVLPAMIRKFHEAKVSGADRVVLWGDGSPYREFLYSGDLAEIVVELMEKYNAADLHNSAGDFINIGTGKDLTIRELAEVIRDIVYDDVPGRRCVIEWDTSKPNGTPRKLLDVSRLKAMGLGEKTGLREGIALAYDNYKNTCKI
jgi:GDP-L-fucose synthase